jgi:Tfp pilus assembly protein PilX
MHSAKLDSRGFTLIASLMLMLIMSGVAIGLLMMVNTEGKVGGQDVQNNLAFHAAEGGIEHMTSDLAAMFQNIESPTALQIEALSADAPANSVVMSYPVYTLTPATNPDGSLATNWGQIATGNYQGLYAQLLPVNLQVTASTSLAGVGTVGDEVNMSRAVEVALIPVFQFGVFSDSDLGFFSSPNLNFAGRVHTNGDLYLGVANGFTLTFHDKLSAWGNVIRQVLPNGLAANAFNDSGTVLIPQATGGCDLPLQPACGTITATEGSVTGAGGDPPASGPTVGPPSWRTISLNAAPFFNGFVTDGNYGIAGGLGTGATNLTLPFVNGTVGPGNGPQPFEIVRRPPPGEVATAALGASRLYNEAEIRVLLSDTPADLPGGAGDPNNIRLTNPNLAGAQYEFGIATSVPPGLPALVSGGSYNTYFAQGTTGYPDTSTWTNALFPAANPVMNPDWPYVPVQPIAADITLTNDQGPPAAPVTTLNPANPIGLTTLTPTLPLVPCPGTPPVCPAAPPPATWWLPPYPYYTPPAAAGTYNTWNLIDGYLRVEYRNAAGAYIPITAEWLQLGFARDTTPPTVAPSPGNPTPAGYNDINPNAILLFQQPADRNGDGVIDQKGLMPVSGGCAKVGVVWNCIKAKPPEVTVDATTLRPWYGDSKAALQSISMYNWYPINFYDPREGESRDIQQNNNSCTPNGIMNAVELDVGNLKRWLLGQTGVSGPLVDFISQNGYILYFSDRRGMLPSVWGTQVSPPGTKTGDSGLEDVVNSAVAAGNPDGALDPVPPAKLFSPEDSNLNSKLDNFGAGNIGLGLGYGTLAAYTIGNSVNRQIINAASPDPYLTGKRLPDCRIGQKNWVSGARHVLKLVDGTLGNLPLRPDNSKGGFTVGSENPVYIFGDYNSNPGDPIWLTPAGADQPGMAAAGVIADAVTVLSNAWLDVHSFYNGWPTNPYVGVDSVGFNVPAPARTATTTYYRVAVAGGKNMNFPFPGWEVPNDYGFGTDGGVHNFLRFLEDWSGVTLNYEGSLVSLYYATYNTGLFKCCNYSVYTPPARNYIFDPDFTVPAKLPPGTPLFRDIDNLSYRQSFTPRATSAY